MKQLEFDFYVKGETWHNTQLMNCSLDIGDMIAISNNSGTDLYVYRGNGHYEFYPKGE